jgi:anti-sigma-K factor RskA
MQGNERLAEFAAAYVLGALEPDEMAQAEASLATDPAFRQAVDDARTAIELLPYATPAVAPPAHLRQAVMRAIDVDHATPAARVPVDSAPARSGHWWQGLSTWFSAWSPALATASVGLIVLLTFATVSSRNELNLEREANARTAPQATAGAQVMAAVISPRSTAVPLQTPTIVPMVDTMQATQAPPQGRLLVDNDGGRLLLLVRHMPPLPRHHLYQAWSVPAGQRPRPLGAIQVGADGTGVLVAPLPEGIERLRDLVVTIEPEVGSDSPTTPPVVAASL